MILSIVLPVYNVEKYLARCLESLVNQDLDKKLYEIIIVIDGSPDNSLKIAQEFQSNNMNIKIIIQQNQGVSAARNTGVKNSIGKFVYFVDPDDYIEKNVLKKVIEIQELLNLDFLGFKVTRTSTSNYKVNIDFSDFFSNPDKINITNGCDFISKNNYINGPWWYITRTDLLQDIGLQFENGRMAEDGIYTTELLLNCDRVAWLNIDIYRYFVNQNSIVMNKNKSHLMKFNDDFIFVIYKFEELIKIAEIKNCDEKALLRIKCRQESYLFFLFIRLIKANVSFSMIKDVINQMKDLRIYPMKNFIGVDYNSKQEKALTMIFNNPFLFYLLVSLNKVFKIIK